MGCTRSGASLPENGNRAGFQNVAHLYEIRWWIKSWKARLCRHSSCSACISWPSQLGSTGCAKMSVWNDRSVPRNISLEGRPHMIWWCRPWFGSARSWFRAIRFSASYTSLRWPHTFKCQIDGNELGLHLSRYSIYPLYREDTDYWLMWNVGTNYQTVISHPRRCYLHTHQYEKPKYQKVKVYVEFLHCCFILRGL